MKKRIIVLVSLSIVLLCICTRCMSSSKKVQTHAQEFIEVMTQGDIDDFLSGISVQIAENRTEKNIKPEEILEELSQKYKIQGIVYQTSILEHVLKADVRSDSADQITTHLIYLLEVDLETGIVKEINPYTEMVKTYKIEGEN